jgi:hypothetical protein
VVRVAFYVDSHGFGHATRSMALAEALPASWEVVFKTNAPEWLFQKELPRPFSRVPSSLDIHPVHSTSYRIDPEGTLQKAIGKIQEIDSLVRQEVDWLQKSGIDVVISDISPVAVYAAKAAGIPGFGVSNFTWDWIFEPLFDGTDDKGVVKTLRKMMATAATNFRLPFSSPETFPEGSVESPLLVRPIRLTRDQARRHYGFADGITYVLVTFGGIEGPVKNMARLMEFQPLQFVGSAKGAESAPPNEQGLFQHSEISNLWILKRDDLYHPDLVNAVDCVVTKPGYGILSECMATATPILLDARDDFREFVAVRATATRYPQIAIVDNPQMEQLDILAPLSKVLGAQSKPWEGSLKGAEFIAKTISEQFL